VVEAVINATYGLKFEFGFRIMKIIILCTFFYNKLKNKLKSLKEERNRLQINSYSVFSKK